MSFLPSAARNSLARSLARTVAPRVLPRAVAIAPPARRLAGPSFSTSSIVRGSGTTDSELSARLAQELAYEQEVAGSQTHSESAEPDFLRDFKSTSIWSIKDEPGSDEIALEREFGNEKIRVLFSIGDIDSSETEGYEADEDANEPEKNETDEDEGDGPAFPVRCAISIAKSKHGALTIDAQADNGIFRIENISFYKDANLATELTAEADWKRRGLYIGPQFPTLDNNVQSQFESFLEERGINEDLALFVPLFAEHKEQKEYTNWLSNVKDFVDA